MRRFVSVWLPQWPVERLLRSSPGVVPADRPLALVQSLQGRLTLTAVNRAARREGLGAGLALADARAAVPALATLPAEPAADLAGLRRLALWMSRYGLRVTLERPAAPQARKSKIGQHRAAVGAPDGVGLEITGVAHLFGGEPALLADLVRRLAGLGLTVRPGLADTPGAAYAIARATAGRHLADRIAPSGETALRLAPLPAAALRLAPETVTLLHRLGLKTIGDLARLPRASLERRFNSREVTAAVLTRLDQALGRTGEPAQPLAPARRYSVRQSFAEPLVSSEGITAALDDLTRRLAASLAAARAGARRLSLTLYRSDGSLVRLAAGLSRPSHEARHFQRLLADKLATVDLGFGVDLMLLAAPASEPLEAMQTSLAGLTPAGVGEVALLIDRLASRLGAESVLRLAPQASHLPEIAEQLVPALEALTVSQSPGPPERLRSGQAPEPAAPALEPSSAMPGRGARPPFLLPHPEPVAVVAEIPDGPPASLEWRRRRCRIVRAEGPERIAPEWWQPLMALTCRGEPRAGAAPRRQPRTRDYYTIEDEAGRRYWVFREGLYGREEGEAPPAWYLHGLFA
ncbi:MAG: DNA polymerase Y family protein [Hyphomicrobiaceae bacterium]